MLTLNRRQLKRLMLSGRRCLVAAMLAAAFPASIYAQNENGLQARPFPETAWPAATDYRQGSQEPANTNRVAQVLDMPGAAANQNPGDTIIRPGQPGGGEGLKGAVQIVIDPDTGDVTLIGDPADTAIVRKSFEELSKQTSKPAAARILLNNLFGEQVAESVQEIYDANYADTQGAAIIKPLQSPNGLYVFGSPLAIKSVQDIVDIVDADPPPTGIEDGPFVTFRLQHISAADAKRRLDGYFGQDAGGGGGGGGQTGEKIPPDPVTTVADFRSNVLIVRGAKQYLEQAKKVIRSIDVDDGGATDVVRIFPLANTIAEEMATVLQDAINGQLPNAGQGFNPNQNGQPQEGQQATADQFSSTLRSAAAKLQTVAADGSVVSGGIMFGVRVTADRNSNSLIIRGPESSMDLIGELIAQLDRLPNSETLLKVFAIENGDAQALLDTLQSLFPDDQGQQQGGGGNNGNTSNFNTPLQSASASSGASLINLRFSIDERTNSIIATGPSGDLQVVEDLISRLDETQADRRQTVVHRLSNSPVLDVQEALDAWIEARQERNGDDPRTLSGVNIADRDVDVIPEVVSNSLIISATPEYLPEIMAVVRRLDRRPPMVKVKVLIAEVNLNALEEFGVELGVQDSLVFDRGLLPFGDPDMANPADILFRETLAGQALTGFGTGRINANGASGLVLSAGSESINILIRALQSRNVLRVLSKPTLVTLENLQGRIQVGQQIPRITGSSQNQIGGGISNSVTDLPVGVILEVTPRVSPDGMIVMFVNAEKSALAVGAPGVAVAVGTDGTPVVQLPINSTAAQTTVMARSGQTVVFSGLIQETKSHSENGIPILSDIPVVGPLFKFESDTAERTELMIMLTPYLVDGDEEIEIQNQDEMDRMHWCLCDVAEVYGKTEYNGYRPEEGAVETIYPDQGFQPVNTESNQAYSDAYPADTSQAYPRPQVDQRQFDYGTPLGQTNKVKPDSPVKIASGIGSFIKNQAGDKSKSLRRSWNPFSKKTVYPNRQASFESER